MFFMYLPSSCCNFEIDSIIAFLSTRDKSSPRIIKQISAVYVIAKFEASYGS